MSEDGFRTHLQKSKRLESGSATPKGAFHASNRRVLQPWSLTRQYSSMIP